VFLLASLSSISFHSWCSATVQLVLPSTEWIYNVHHSTCWMLGSASKLLHWLSTVSSALGLPTSVALPAQSLTLQAVLVSASAERGDLFVPRTRTTRLRRWSFFIAAPVVWNSLLPHLRSPSISRSQFQAGLRLIFSDWPFTDFSSENYWRDWTGLNIVQLLKLLELYVLVLPTAVQLVY